jgi:hypothetical protein
MPQNEPRMRGERPSENPYAPPRTEIGPALVDKDIVEVGNQRRNRLRRESCIRVAGLIGVVVAGCVVLTFGLGAVSELYRQEDEGYEPWMYRRRIVRIISVISIAVLAFVTSWGLFRLRNWGRWALTIVTTLPVPALVCGWLLRSFTLDPGIQGMVNPACLTTVSVMSALSCPLLLFLMWSPRGEMVFSHDYSEIIPRTPGSCPGYSGILPALAALSAELASYFVLLLIMLSILVILGLIRSI